MNSRLLAVLAGAVVLALTAFVVLGAQGPPGSDVQDHTAAAEDTEEAPAAAGPDAIAAGITEAPATATPEATAAEDAVPEEAEEVEEPARPEVIIAPEDRYLEYSPTTYTQAAQSGATIVLFYYADWCASCRAADAEFRANLESIPANVTILVADFDIEDALKRRYRVTEVHTFVKTDTTSSEIARWEGGSLEELLAHIE